MFLSPPCEIVDEEDRGRQQAVVVGGEGKMEGCVSIILLAGSSESRSSWCHLGLHPPFLLFVCTLPSPVTSSSGFIHRSLYSACLPLFHHFKGLLPSYVSAVHLQSQAFTGVCTCIIFCHSLSQLSSLTAQSTLCVCSFVLLHS